jgi:hypothetical protein
MILEYINQDNTRTKFSWSSNYSFAALTEKYLWATGKKKVTSAKLFLDWCAENSYIKKEQM